MKGLRVAVIGAGIMGCCAALMLGRAGHRVTLIDRASAAMTGASRWNEGKIHLGYLYAGDPSGETARKLLPGGLSFRRLIEPLLDCSLAPAISHHDDIYFVHPDSIASADDMRAYFQMVDRELENFDGADYLGPIVPSAPLPDSEIARLANRRITSGFRVSERSVNTNWVADRMIEAVAREERIVFTGRRSVQSVQPAPGATHREWDIVSASRDVERFECVINCSWDSLLTIDKSAGLEIGAGWSHRYRLALFLDTEAPVDVPSAVLSAGPFGDIKSYDGRHFYLSWYPAGLVAEGNDVEPPAVTSPKPQQIIDETRAALIELLPPTKRIFDAASRIEVAGGWVFAQGRGSLTDPHSTLHRRDRLGIRTLGTYFSVDTGKYSSAPLLAQVLTERIASATG